MSIEPFRFAIGDESRGYDAGRDLGRLLVFDRRPRGVVHGRSPARLRRGGLDHFAIQLLVEGIVIAGAPGDERILSPGDVILLDMSRPQVAHASEACFITVAIPREVIEAAAPDARLYHGCVLPQAACGLLGDLMASLARRGGSIAPEAAAWTSRALAELLAGALAGSIDTPSAPAEDIPAGSCAERRLERARAHIEAHLADPRLDAARVAAGVAVSRSVLYRLFAPAGGVAQYILARRLERLRAALRHPGETRSVTTLAYDHGFASESHCIRSFRAAYGVPPGRYRQEARAGAAEPEPDTAPARGRPMRAERLGAV